ncbi:AAA family ATPase [Enterococcus faecalis]|uniref:AAA family ATPase n=1 Tax=Enterococcus faecalis TaxID=1351 RepID=UPI001141A9EB|nr:AAA family ATPase [Enterococcus faecalis]NSV47096.1 AAA family ATPase [Enterococcus faecalis]TQA41335.1 AAA family ATPase [Enterococcus faecalis]
MKLKQLRLKNFRGYKYNTYLEVSDLTALIGKNDAGKSTILEALEIFFNNKLIVCEREDLSVKSTSDSIEISCVFSDFPDSLIIDSASSTTLEKENLLNQDGLLEIKKVFKCSTSKPKPQTFIACVHPSANKFNDLLLLKQADLKKRATELGVDESTYDKRNNSSIRQAILEQSSIDLEKKIQDIPVDSQDAKKLYSSLETFLPVFALFQSDRSSSDSDKEITDPMSIAISQALQGLEKEMNKIKLEVQAKATETASRTLKKLKEMNSELAESLTPEFKSDPKFDSLFKLTIKSDDDISINKRGSGVRRLILLNFFRAEAERKLSENERNNDIIYAFEEPETSQHPSHQKLLIESFIELSNKDNCQVLLTTHTPALGELLPLESLRLIEKNNGIASIHKEDEATYDKIKDTLGILSEQIPNTAKAIILVEGKTDLIFFEHLCKILKDNNQISSTFLEKNIVLTPTGGCDNLKAWVTRQVVNNLGLPFAIFLDSDRMSDGEETKNTRLVSLYQSHGVKAFHTRKREAENYLHPDLFNGEVEIEDFNDVKEEVYKFNNKVRRNKILEKYWVHMNFGQIREREIFIDESGNQHFELTEIVRELLDII